MCIKEKFINFLHTKTTDDFHDAVLVSINFNFKEKRIVFNIYHWKNENNYDGFFDSFLTFLQVEKLTLESCTTSFLNDNEIYSFDIIEDNDNHYFKLIGSEGWVLSFKASDFTYEEKFIGVEY